MWAPDQFLAWFPAQGVDHARRCYEFIPALASTFLLSSAVRAWLLLLTQNVTQSLDEWGNQGS